MWDVIDRWPTHVHGDFTLGARDKLHLLALHGVVNLNAHVGVYTYTHLSFFGGKVANSQGTATPSINSASLKRSFLIF